MSAPYAFLKGHGTRNDFVLLPDHDGTVHGALSDERVRALCDRRSGIGADGVLRVVRVDGSWFMDYRNADGSIAEMCGNGLRVFARHLVDEGLVDGDVPIAVETRDGTKIVVVDGDQISVDMGFPRLRGETKIGVGDRTWVARHVDTGNPHAVVWVDDLADAGSLLDEPDYDHDEYHGGVNVEFVVRRGEQHVAVRVHERGSGETPSCGTGACAVAVVASMADGDLRGVDYRVDLPGGTLVVRRTDDDRVLMTGPAVIVARGTTDL